jgi:glycerol-3-phosphate dehydrogenase
VAALDRLDGGSFDVVVIGGGVTGVGCALDAATRGLSVALVEQRDLAAGTSSRSSKLIHGGLRYLERLDFGLVHEALRERSLLVSLLAPHLVRPLRFVYPLRHHVWERAYVGAGILLYDALAARGHNPLQGHRHLSRRGVLAKMPALRRDALVGGIEYSDAQVDDARHTMMVGRTAAGLGATVATSVRASGMRIESGHVVGVDAVCLETGRRLAIGARVVVNATGVWTDRVEDLSGHDALRVTASKGIHLVVPRDRIAAECGMIIRTEKSVLFLIPWGDHWIIGTTDTAWDLDLAHPAASRTDIDYLLGHVNEVLARPLERDDVVGVYAGLRPLLAGESDATSKLTREHAVVETAPGLVTVAGGKYTTYRVMAEDTIDAAVASWRPAPAPSATRRTPILGADGYAEMMAGRSGLAADSGLAVERIDHLLGRYGDRVTDLLGEVERDPELAAAIPGAPGYLLVEAGYAVSHEAALHLDDVLTRRTRISIETPDRGLEAAAAVVPLMAAELGWDEATVAREMAHYRARVEAERQSQTMPDDHTADAARLGAPDVRMGMRTSKDD